MGEGVRVKPDLNQKIQHCVLNFFFTYPLQHPGTVMTPPPMDNNNPHGWMTSTHGHDNPPPINGNHRQLMMTLTHQWQVPTNNNLHPPSLLLLPPPSITPFASLPSPFFPSSPSHLHHSSPSIAPFPSLSPPLLPSPPSPLISLPPPFSIQCSKIHLCSSIQ